MPSSMMIFVVTVNDMIFHMTELLIERNEARRGIQIVATAVTNIQAFETQLTVVHTNLCHVSRVYIK